MTKCKHYATPVLQAQYGGQDCKTIAPTKPTHTGGGNLPFTGFDGGLFLIVAVIFVASGTALRRAGRRINPA